MNYELQLKHFSKISKIGEHTVLQNSQSLPAINFEEIQTKNGTISNKVVI